MNIKSKIPEIVSDAPLQRLTIWLRRNQKKYEEALEFMEHYEEIQEFVEKFSY